MQNISSKGIQVSIKHQDIIQNEEKKKLISKLSSSGELTPPYMQLLLGVGSYQEDV